jgi:hypothetical protein
LKRETVAIFSCKGLGDGLISIALANNLIINDYEVSFFHNNFEQLQDVFLDIVIKKFPQALEIEQILNYFAKIFISYEEDNFFSMKLIEEGKKKCPQKIYVLNPCASKKVGGQPYYRDACFSPNVSMVENIDFFCKKILKLKKTTKIINYFIPKEIQFKKNLKRVIIHPSSAKKGKNWPINKYLDLAIKLKTIGYDPVFVVGPNEEEFYKVVLENNFKLVNFKNLKDLTYFIYESALMIGNDSGIGHLASMLGIRTISIFRNYRSAKLWRPGWSDGRVIYPSRLIFNFSGFRLRDKKWKHFVSIKKVFKNFISITTKTS